MTPVEFYAARLDEYEQAARRSLDAPAGALRYSDNDEWTEGLAWLVSEERVLREVEAGRRLIKRYELAVAAAESASASSFVSGQDDGYRQACLDAIRDAAGIDSDHPDYQQEWALTPA